MRTVQERKHASINEQPGCKRTAEHESKFKSENERQRYAGLTNAQLQEVCQGMTLQLARK
jgi:hypothetical protein